MVVGCLRLDLHLPHCSSLKEKRQAVKSVTERLRARRNVSVAEVDHHDLWQRGALGVSCVSISEFQARRLLKAISSEVAGSGRVTLIGETVRFFAIDD